MGRWKLWVPTLWSAYNNECVDTLRDAASVECMHIQIPMMHSSDVQQHAESRQAPERTTNCSRVQDHMYDSIMV